MVFGGLKTPKEPAFVTEYCWRFLHPNPRVGWCGGDDADCWTDNLKEVETNASLCERPTQILRRTREIGKRFIVPGSLKLHRGDRSAI